MQRKTTVLLVGESCFATMREFKGLDCFTETNYHEAAESFIAKLTARGYEVTHIPCHLVARCYPRTLEELQRYDAVLFSDVGSNSFLLLPEVVKGGSRAVNLLSLTREYVEAGGGFCMIGGYMTYQGMEGKGKWKDSPLEEILPVRLQYGDDRCEVPEGVDLTCVPDSHPVLRGLPALWPYILGYNKTQARPEAQVLVHRGEDPIIAVRQWGKGRTMAYTTDCAPHWSPAAMCEWDGYPQLWDNIVSWLAGSN
ncbi:MAG: glutamine amidotransferase [Oscillibacter sp.]|nr:glutamine amidotransferase [Oscillibacter sp.]